MLAFFQCKCVHLHTVFSQTVNKVLIFPRWICSHFHSILRWSQMKKHHGHRRWVSPFSMWSLEKLLAASFSGEQSSRTEGKWIPTQRSVLPQEAHLPPLLLVEQLETVTLGAAQHGEIHRTKSDAGCVSLAQDEVHWRTRTQDILEDQALNLYAFSALLAPFFVHHHATF